MAALRNRLKPGLQYEEPEAEDGSSMALGYSWVDENESGKDRLQR
jgi:hypothetical protein